MGNSGFDRGTDWLAAWMGESGATGNWIVSVRGSLGIFARVVASFMAGHRRDHYRFYPKIAANASTTDGSNWVPEARRISASASGSETGSR